MDRLSLRAVLAVAVLAVASPASAQSDRDRLRERCAALPGTGADGCAAAAIAVEALVGGVGLALTGGNEFPGSASTLGKRFGTTPRVAAGARFGIVDVGSPDVRATGGWGGSTSSWVPSLQGSVAVNVFDGFRPRPTVGGVLGVDVMATGGIAFLPGDGGFDGAASAFGYGVRVGVVRESFSLPGITLSAVRRHGGGLEWGGSRQGSAAVVLDGFTATSLRATVGREFMALGIQGGVGWDRVTADGRVQADPEGALGGGIVEFDGFDAERPLFFGGVTATWLVMQLHAEAVYALGYDAGPAEAPTGFDPSAGNLMGTLTFRILF